ncbi:fibrinogen-binding adhesin SdrG C-terminal domain-containing protein [Streptococcus equi subsp. zooepidemicus]|uniref:SpaA isopeptide-forming pilin-related protein n=1 Tax=Streptococcus equi TaxID=1336 RepID=UPI001E42D6EC|nr:fibrinogen-binding adhesin SdrG C-terminal domain-containing protein [Streptococcus equi subsp. zooepidemicus]MCD3380055.1 fibrinogen-binding adhesin SdrG C-terminal domain-containing protein [Streptococcus equi subsp. zooepidemicus]HEL0564016.1 fibrinogen-binding adhesin SdrG C-terminal domain-containing protein [Streptococcus equi subsp. zooepidemicus]HEL1248079.1 fibrinogen-binding adhesin SdrG C-terminal domain-containing protein [Streptococcus equi subsp. zooepidemicus]HEL1282740.1 fibr
MGKEKLKKILVKLAALLAIIQLILPTSLTAATVLSEQINTENPASVATATGETITADNLDFKKATSESGAALKNGSVRWLQVTYNKGDNDLAKQDLFLTVPKGMIVEGIGQENRLEVGGITVPEDLAFAKNNTTINNTKLVSGFEKIADQVYKISFEPTTEMVNLVFKVNDTITDEPRELLLRDHQEQEKASLIKRLVLGAGQDEDRASIASSSQRPTIQPRAARATERVGNQGVSSKLTATEKTGDQKIKVVKRDELTGQPLANAKFQLKASDGALYHGTTNEKGELIFDKLPYGQYVLTETEAPPGYMLDPIPHDINITEVGIPETEVVASGNAIDLNSTSITRAAVANSVLESMIGKNVSNQITIKNLDITSSNEDTPYNVRPNNGENILIRAAFAIKPESTIKAGDFFTIKLPETIDPFGISALENVGFRIMGPLGTLALGSYDTNTRTITYRFTDYITRYAVSSFSMISPFFVDRYTVKTNQDIDIFLTLGNEKTASQRFAVNYFPYIGQTDTKNPVNIGSMITKLNQDSGDFVNYIYINPLQKSLEKATLTFTGNGSTILNQNTKIQLFKVDNPHLQMPSSWGVEDSSLQEVAYDNIKKENGRIIINFDNDLLYGQSYIVKISGKSDTSNPAPVHTEATLTQQYYNDYPYWTPSGRYIPYGPYTEAFIYSSDVVKKSGESNADGAVVVNMTNRKNYIGFVKTDAQGKSLEATFELRKKTANGLETVGDSVTSDKTTGKFYFEGLSQGDYELWETKAPNGYIKPTEAVATFKVTATGEIVDKSLEDGRIINYKAPELPATGGAGILLYLLIGGCLCFIAIFWKRSNP